MGKKRKQLKKCSTSRLHTLLDRIYHDVKSVGSFGGVDLLWAEFNKRSGCPKQRKEFVKAWLSTNPTYTCHRPARRNFPRAPVVVAGPEKQWQIDLIDVTAIRDQNDGNTFILTAIDVFSRMAWAEPVKSKSAADVLKAFKIIFERSRAPITAIQSDQGKEFHNKTFKSFLASHGIILFSTLGSETKACIVER